MKIVVYGAGGIGCYVGGRLAATGTPVTLVGRQRMAGELASHGLRMTDYLGALDIQRHPALAPYLDAFPQAGLPLEQHDDILPVQWAKLLLNLNNPINALSNLPLREELSQRAYRRCLAAAQAETLELLDAEGIRPAQPMPVPMHRFPAILRLPDFLFRRIAGKMLAIDPLARTSMWEDLEAGRPTEIDYLNGEVVRLADSLGRPVPINRRLVDLIRAAEAARRAWSGPDLLRELA